MPFAKTANVAQYKGANWDNYIMTVPNTTPQAAQRIAMCNPQVTFFFYCKSTLILEGVSQNGGVFNTGDAVFFSGEPWYGSAPQCDSYQKSFFTVGYVGVNSNNFANIGCYTLQDGRQYFDIGIMFAANINMYPLESGVCEGCTLLVPTSMIPEGGGPAIYANPQTYAALQSGAIKQMQDLGITVVMSVLGNHDNAGWANFSSAAQAQNFAQQLQYVVNEYGLDGIDIDDEYSTGTPNAQSMIMVTYYMRQLMPDKIISKALYADIGNYPPFNPDYPNYFGPTWAAPDGSTVTLADNLSYGWEMSYWLQNCMELKDLLQTYTGYGMPKNTLGGGVSTDSTGVSAAEALSKCVQSNAYGGMMIFDITKTSQNYLSVISNVLYGETTTVKSNCLQ